MNYSVFSVDELDVLSEMTKETELANEKFASEVIDPQLQEFDKITCTCGAKIHNNQSIVKTLGENGEVVEAKEGDIPIGGVVLEPIGEDNKADNTVEPFSYGVVIRSVDNVPKSVVCIIRSCKKCGDIRIRGDLDDLTKTIGISYMNLLDFETKEAQKAAEESTSKDCGGNCSACSHSCVDPEVVENDGATHTLEKAMNDSVAVPDDINIIRK